VKVTDHEVMVALWDRLGAGSAARGNPGPLHEEALLLKQAGICTIAKGLMQVPAFTDAVLSHAHAPFSPRPTRSGAPWMSRSPAAWRHAQR
jgi:hypothetical protein